MQLDFDVCSYFRDKWFSSVEIKQVIFLRFVCLLTDFQHCIFNPYVVSHNISVTASVCIEIVESMNSIEQSLLLSLTLAVINPLKLRLLLKYKFHMPLKLLWLGL